MEKLNFNTPMNQTEIEQAIALLKEGLKRGVFTYEHANPIEQNCYISSNYIEGLYFPNTTIKTSAHSEGLKFVCLAKVKYQLVAVFEWKDSKYESLNGKYHTDRLKDLVFTQEENEVTDELTRRIKNLSEDLESLSKIKRVHKKDGKDFATLTRNFEGVYSLNCDWYGYPKKHCHSVYVNGYYLSLKQEKDTEPSADEIESLINAEKEILKKNIKAHRERLKRVAQNVRKIYRLVKPLRAYLNTLDDITEFYLYRRTIENLIKGWSK